MNIIILNIFIIYHINYYKLSIYISLNLFIFSYKNSYIYIYLSLLIYIIIIIKKFIHIEFINKLNYFNEIYNKKIYDIYNYFIDINIINILS